MTLFFTSLAVVLTLLSAFMMDKLEAQNQYFPYSNHQNSSSFMRLSLSFNLSIASSYTAGRPIDDSGDLMFTVGVPNLDRGLFLPILSSSSFNSSSKTGGFSLGFYFWCSNTEDEYSYNLLDCYVYMAVCAGSSGNMRHSDLDMQYSLGTGDLYYLSLFNITRDGFVIPVWIANLDHPIKNPLTASLVVVAAHDNSSKDVDVVELQLRDGNEVVWNVRDVGLMEMSDSGYFSIYRSASPTSAPVFQSTLMDTLVEGQNLTVGMHLTSNDSAYSARVEKGGLVLSPKYSMDPYWIFPFLRSTSPVNLTMNGVISSAPCNDTHHLQPYIHTRFNYSFDVYFETGECSSSWASTYGYNYLRKHATTIILWSFLRLESDGRLYAYAVSNSSHEFTGRAVTRLPLSSSINDDDFIAFHTLINRTGGEILFGTQVPFMSWTGTMQDVGTDCDVPLACGPLGICTAGGKSICGACPNYQYFEPINATDFSQGCKPLTSLPSCMRSTPGSSSSGINNDDHTNSTAPTTSFVELNSTANIFLLTG